MNLSDLIKRLELIFYHLITSFYLEKIGESYTIKNENLSDLTLIDGDSIHLSTKPNIKKYIQVSGHVRNPGKYPLIKISLKTYITQQ